MLLRTPFFFRDFHCIADKCTDSCCIGWEVDVDENIQARYREYDKEAQAEYLQKKNRRPELQQIKEPLDICSQIENGSFKLQPGNRCPFLRKDGLCEIICRYGVNGTDLDKNGKSVLGDICREHPRFVEVYGDIMEKGVGLCCEEAVKLLLEFQSKSYNHHQPNWDFCNTNILPLVESQINDIPDEMPEGAEEARDAIFAEREEIFKILSNETRPLVQRLIEVLDFAEKCALLNDEDRSETTDENSDTSHLIESSPNFSEGFHIPCAWIALLSEGESYGPAWDAAYQRIQLSYNRSRPTGSGITFTDCDGARIVAYLIFRYYAKSLFDGDSLSKVKFAIFFWLILKNFGEELSGNAPKEKSTNNFTAKINAIKLLSKQTEYSDEVMNNLYAAFDETRFTQSDANDNPFSLASFKAILQAQ